MAYCAMLDSVSSAVSCSSSSLSGASGLESIMASPPSIPDLRISVEVSEPEAKAVQLEVLVDERASVVSPECRFLYFCVFLVLLLITLILTLSMQVPAMMSVLMLTLTRWFRGSHHRMMSMSKSFNVLNT
jgi:hypothetical protein